VAFRLHRSQACKHIGIIWFTWARGVRFGFVSTVTGEKMSWPVISGGKFCPLSNPGRSVSAFCPFVTLLETSWQLTAEQNPFLGNFQDEWIFSHCAEMLPVVVLCVFSKLCVICDGQSGALVSVVRGANCPLLVQTITDQLAHEHKVLEGMAERKEVGNNFLNCATHFYMMTWLIDLLCTEFNVPFAE